MNKSSNDYKAAYDSAKRELAEIIGRQEQLEKRKLSLRKSIEALSVLCESEGIQVEPSREAEVILEQSTLADEIRLVLKSNPTTWSKPHTIMGVLELLGHDLGKYKNPQASIQMVLKRMADAGEVTEREMPDGGKKVYKWSNGLPIIPDAPWEKAELQKGIVPAAARPPDLKSVLVQHSMRGKFKK